MTDDQKAALAKWVPQLEAIMYSGSPVASELNYWLNAMGFFMVGGKLTLPYSSYAGSTASTLLYKVEEFWLAYWPDFPNAPMWATYYPMYYPWGALKGKPTYAATNTLLADYPFGSYNFFTVLTAVYERVQASLNANWAALHAVVPTFDSRIILSGLLVLFEFWMVWGSWIHAQYPVSYVAGGEQRLTATATIGPYTVTVGYCENGISYTVTETENPQHIAHQSVDAEILVQDGVQTELDADLALSARNDSELDADVALQANVPVPFEASLPLRGEVRPPLKAYEALRDETQKTLTADSLLSEPHSYNLGAYERLQAVPWSPLDADICIIGPVQKPLYAYMLLLPDSASEMLTELEKYHIQAMRIKADPRAYKEFNSATDTEVVP